MSSYKLISNSFTDRTKILNLENNSISLDNLNLSQFYLGDFDIYKINSNGTFDIEKSNNRVIEVFTTNNIVGYFERGIYDEQTNKIINEPFINIENIGYLNIDNNKIIANIRAGEDAGKGAIETWEVNNYGETIKSFYSINSNVDNRPVLWVGEFKRFNLQI